MAANGSNVTAVTSSATAVPLLAANTSRRKDASGPSVVIANASTAILYILLGTGTGATGEVSATNYTYQIAANGVPQEIWGYSGGIRGIWAAANGNATVTELV